MKKLLALLFVVCSGVAYASCGCNCGCGSGRPCSTCQSKPCCNCQKPCCKTEENQDEAKCPAAQPKPVNPQQKPNNK